MNTTSQPTATAVHVLPVDRIAHLDLGWTRGHATGCIDEFPAAAPGRLEFGSLLLATVQEIDAGAGYPMHHHQGIETVIVALAGTIAHDDSVGGRGLTGPDDIAVLDAGAGIDHEEMALDQPARAVMFWLRSPVDAPARFAKQTLLRADRRERLVAVAGGESGLPLRADAAVHTGALSAGTWVHHRLAHGRGAYLVSTDGAISVNGQTAQPGDRVLVTGPGTVAICALGATEVVLLDVRLA